MTVNAASEFDDSDSPSLDPSSSATRLPSSNSSGGDEERALLAGSPNFDETELQTRIPPASSRQMSVSSTIKQKTSQFIDVVRNGRYGPPNRDLPEKLVELVVAYENSSTARRIQAEYVAARSANSPAFHSGSNSTPGEVSAQSNGTIGEGGERAGMIEMRDVIGETGLLRGRRSASWATQFRILSGRAFKNLYRDPALLAAHYFGSIALACECRVHTRIGHMLTWVIVICGLFFHNVGNDIAGFQNRLGKFIFGPCSP